MNRLMIAAALALLVSLLISSQARADPIAYHGLVVTDVTVNGTFHHYATVRIDLLSDTSRVHHKVGTTLYTNSFGTPVIHVDTGSSTYAAEIDQNQIYAVADIPNLLAGFGATSGGYLLFITQAGGQSGGHTTIAALADVLAMGNSGNYSTDVFNLGSNLKTATNLTGAAFSCPVAPTAETSQTPFGPPFDSFPTYGCAAGTPAVTIATNLGPITLYSPYLDYANPSVPPTVPYPYSLNWGVFWAEMPPSMGDD